MDCPSELTTPSSGSKASGNPALGRDELNFAEFPLASLSRGSNRQSASESELVFEDTIRDKKTGRDVQRRLTIRAHPKYGIPTAYDEDVLIALIHYTKQSNNFRDRKVPFTRKQLLSILGWPDSGQSYHRLDESLGRWVNTHLHYTGWWDKARAAWVEEHFHILDNVSLIRKSPCVVNSGPIPEELPRSSFQWNTTVFNSFQSGNLKQLNLDKYFRLTLAPARRAYRYLDKYFYRTSRLELDLQTFACEHIGLSRSHTPSKLKAKLQPSIMELEKEQVIAPLGVHQRFVKHHDQSWRIVLSKPVVVDDQPTLATVSSTTLAIHPMEAELLKRGVNAKKAKQLAKLFPTGRISEKLIAYDAMMKDPNRRINRNPPGWLVRSIEDNYAAVPQRPAMTSVITQPISQPRVVSTKNSAPKPPRCSLLAERYDSLSTSEQAAIRTEALRHTHRMLRESWERALADGKESRADAMLRLIIENFLRGS